MAFDATTTVVNLAIEMKEFGKNYLPENLVDIEWCVRELAVLGYSISITYVTRAYARELFGREPDYPTDIDGLYTYQLWGPRYPSRGTHPSPLISTLHEAVLIALYNICRLDYLDTLADNED